MKYTFVAVSAPALYQVQRFADTYRKEYPEGELAVTAFYVAGSEQRYRTDPRILIDAIRTADVAVIDTMGASEELQEIVRAGLEKCQGHRIVIGNALREYLQLGSFSMASMRKASTRKTEQPKQEKKTASALDKMHRMRRMAQMLGNVLPFGITKDMKNVFLLIDYWQQATEVDITSFMHLILRQYGGQKFLPKEKPCTMKYGIYLKDPFTLACTDSYEEYGKEHPFATDRPTVALLFYGHSYPNDFLPVVKELVNEWKESFNILPIAFSQNEDGDLDKLERFLCQKKYPVSAVVNLMPFRLGAGPMGGDALRAVKILQKLNVPYLKPFCLTKTFAEEWKHESGVNPGEFLIHIMLPELDGGILSVPVGIAGQEKNGLSVILPMEERIGSLQRRLLKLTDLQKKENKEKKLAVIFYNYPPGESNVFGGAFLDTFASASMLLQQLGKAGYDVENMTAEELKETFVTEGNCNQPRWSEEQTSGIVYEKDGKIYQIKGIQNGNIFLGLQPVREEKNMEKNYHDRNEKPSAEYEVFYRWIQECFQADAIIHFGTHGTLEFLPGKETGMTGECWPDKLLGDIPHFYYYYMGNPSEAMVAKRRSLATLISYQAPPFRKSGLYGELQELRETVAEYRESLQSAPERCGDLLDVIGMLVRKTGIMGSVEGSMDAKTLDNLDERLYEYENSLITDGLHKINEEETRGLLKALNGEYISVGTAGDVIKNPDILPSGRNLVQFDPRQVPTRTAWERGAKTARLSIEACVNKTGNYPNTAAVILWGLETSRSQGETIGQILYYLGLRLKTEKESYDDRLEVIPAEELKRPRIDVVIHICGFFRDMYPNLIDNLNAMLQQLLQTGESDEENYYAKNTREMARQLIKEGMEEEKAMELASCRIFGPKEGEYGTRLTRIVREGSWTEASEIGNSFVEDLSYGYTCRRKGVAAKELLERQYPHVDLVSQVRNNTEYELTDLDHYYEFYGGLSKAVEQSKGEKPLMLVADTTGEDVKVRGIQEELNRGIFTRLLNPVWIEGMMHHDYHGVQQINRRFENVMGFAATTEAVPSELFSRMTQCYAADQELRSRMQSSNPWAYMNMMERLMEASNRGYFDATEEELETIRGAYLEAEGEAEE